jgi:hypothetical protein
MIVDAKARKFRHKESTASAVVFVSGDGEWWEPVMPYNVPECIKSPDIMAAMLAGEVIETTQRKYYMAERTN